jgi:hypothetical protein
VADKATSFALKAVASSIKGEVNEKKPPGPDFLDFQPV